MSALTTCFQHGVLYREVGQKKNKVHKYWKREVILYVFADDMIIYVETLRNLFLKNLVALLSEFIKEKEFIGKKATVLG